MDHAHRVLNLLNAHFDKTKTERSPDSDGPGFTYYATLLGDRVHVRFEALGDVDPAKSRAAWDDGKAVLAEHGYAFVEGTGPYKGWFTISSDG